MPSFHFVRSPAATRAAFLAGAGALALTRTTTRAATFDFACGAVTAIDHPVSVRGAQMCKTIERESNGQVRIKFFPASQLGGDIAVVSQVRIGATGMAIPAAGSLSTVSPIVDMANIGFVFKDADDAMRVMDGQLGALMQRDVATRELVMLAEWWDAAMLQIGSYPRPIHTPDDLRGFKLRTTSSKITTDMFQTLGASPSATSAAEVYSAVQTHVLDGEAAPLGGITTQRWYEVNKYVSLTNHSWSGLPVIINAALWKSMPSDLQQIIARNNRKYCLMARHDLRIYNASVADRLRRLGLVLNAVNQEPFRAKLGDYYQRWAKEFGAEPWQVLETSLGHHIG